MALSKKHKAILQQAKNEASVSAVYREQYDILLKAINQVLSDNETEGV